MLKSCERGFPNFPFNIMLLSRLTHNRKEDCVFSSAAVCPKSKSLRLLWKSNPDTVFTALKDPLTLFVSATGTQAWENAFGFLHPERSVMVLLILFANSYGLVLSEDRWGEWEQFFFWCCLRNHSLFFVLPQIAKAEQNPLSCDIKSVSLEHVLIYEQ